MIDPGEILSIVAAALAEADIPYMVTGSFASSYHGRPRSTQDIDIIIAPTEAGLRTLLNAFPEPRYYLSEEAAFEAVSRKSQFNLVEGASGWKVDFIVQKGRPFSQEEFSRRKFVDINGIRLCLASPEDVILSKLEWACETQSERQIEDAAGIVKRRWSSLDRSYLETWIAKLGVEPEWEKALKLANPMGNSRA